VAAAAFFLLVSPGALHAQTETQAQKKVLLLWSGRPDLPANVVVNQTIRSALFREFGADVDILFEFVESAGEPARLDPVLRDFLRAKYSGLRFDLVIAVASNAIQFARTYAGELFPGVPLVGWGAGTVVENWNWGPGPPFAAALGRVDAPGTVELILRLQPGTRRLVVVEGGSAYDNLPIQSGIRRALETYADRLTISYLSRLPLEELRKAVASLPKDSAILYAGVQGDGTGRRLVNVDVLASLAEVTSVPIYATAGSTLGAGTVGGAVTSQELLSVEAAKLAVRALRGEPVERMGIIHVPSIPMVDWRQMRRWDLPEDRLPAGTKVLFREPSLWEVHKWRILGIVLVCLAQAVMIGLLLVERARSRRAADELRRAEAVAEEQRRELAHLSRVSMLGELSGTLAHELNQPLAAMLINAQTAQQYLGRTPPNLDEVAKSIEAIVESDQRASEIVVRHRRMLKRGEPQAQPLQLNDLAREVLDLAKGDLDRQRVSRSLELDPTLPPISGDRVQLQQVLLNLVLNACDSMGHMPESHRSLRIRTSLDRPGSVHLQVADQGPGIPSADLERIFEPFVTSKPQGLGLGLSICRTIVTAHGGHIYATNEPERGAALHVVLPGSAETRH